MANKNTANDPAVKEGKLYAMVSYLGILCLIPLFFKKDNAFALFHGKQGLVLFIGEIAISIIAVIPLLGSVIAFFGILLCGVLSLIGIAQSLMGSYWKMPIVAGFAEKISL